MSTQRPFNFQALQTLAIFAAALWFLIYNATVSNPQPVVLVMGWFLLMPIAMVRLVWTSMQVCSLAIRQLLLQKNYQFALAAARYNHNVCQALVSATQFGGADNSKLKSSLLSSRMTLAACLAMADNIDEEIEIRKLVVEQANEAGLLCEAASCCDFLSWRYGNRKDTIHQRHWAERSVNYFSNVAAGSCRCGKTHKSFTHKQAALEATLALMALEGNFVSGAEKHAANAEALLKDCSNEESEVALIRLIGYSFDSKDFDQFERVSERYLSIEKPNAENHFLAMKAKILIRRGIIRGATAERHIEAVALIQEGIDIAVKLNKPELAVEGQKAMAQLPG